MSNKRKNQQANRHSSTLRSTALLVLLTALLTMPATLAAENIASTTPPVNEQPLSTEQEVQNTATASADSRDDLEPSTLALLALGLIALGLVRRKVRE